MKAKILNNDKYNIHVLDVDNEERRIEDWFNRELSEHKVTDGDISRTLLLAEKERKLSIREHLEQQRRELLKPLEEYKEIVYTEHPVDVPPYALEYPYFVEEDDKIVQKWEIRENDKGKMSCRMRDLKKELSDTDYRVLKCYEAALTSSDMPYDVEALIKERKEKREEINRIEELLSKE